MISSWLDQASTSAGERYVQFLNGLRGIMATADHTDPRDMRAFKGLRAGAYVAANTYMSAEMRMFDLDLQRTHVLASKKAQADTDVECEGPDDLNDYADVMASWYRQEIRAQVERDINSIVQKRRNVVVSSQVSAYTGQDIRTAYGRILAEAGGKVPFYFTDRSGRRYPSQKFIRQLYRHSLVTYGVNVYAMEAARRGADTVSIVHPDENYAHQGALYSLNGAPGMKHLNEAMDEVFHPNSRAFLKAEG